MNADEKPHDVSDGNCHTDAREGRIGAGPGLSTCGNRSPNYGRDGGARVGRDFRGPNRAPKDDKEWASVQNSALILAEVGNLLMIPGRAKDTGDWMKFAKALRDAGSEAFKAANDKDAKALETIGDKIDDTCETCHAKYLPKPPQ